eukprot:2562767-Rhodomonas_salina.1
MSLVMMTRMSLLTRRRTRVRLTVARSVQRQAHPCVASYLPLPPSYAPPATDMPTATGHW